MILIYFVNVYILNDTFINSFDYILYFLTIYNYFISYIVEHLNSYTY